MSDDEDVVPVASAESVATQEEVSAALTPADQMAEVIVAVLDRLEERIPDLRQSDPEVARRARGARTVSPEFVSSLIAMVDASPWLQSLKTIDRDKARAVLQSRDALRRIGERVTRFLETVNHTKEAKWAEVVAEAMATYRMANAAADEPGTRYLGPHLAILRRHLRRTSGPKRSKKPRNDAE